MGKTTLILAPLIVGGLALYLAFWLGKIFERAKQRLAAEHISPALYERLLQFVRGVLNPTDLTDPPYLPGKVREEGTQLVAEAVENVARVSRAERRRHGF